MDAVYFLTDLLREKSDLEGDGVALVGKALGGNNPRLKINSLRSETDWNVQRGVEQLLRGIYQAIRNPRSHERTQDSETDAVSIIVFIDYLTRLIGQSRSPFTKHDFLDRVFDPNFVKQERYAELLVAEIPASKRLEVFFDVYEKKEKGDVEALSYFVSALCANLNPDETEEVHRAISEEFRVTDSDAVVRTVIKAFPSGTWSQLDEVARLRVENKLLKSVEEGDYSIAQEKCRRGALGTWLDDIAEEFSMKKELATVLIRKLRSDNFEEQEYVFRFLVGPLFIAVGQKETETFRRLMLKGLKAGDQRFKDALNYLGFFYDAEWSEELSQALDEFVAVEPTRPVNPFEDDDLPF